MIKKFLLISFLSFALFSLTAHTHYSSIGIDHDESRQAGIHYHYYRLYWSGYGSIFLGRGITLRTQTIPKTLEQFDPAAVFLRTPHKKTPEAKTLWNQLGFWWVSLDLPHSQQNWVGIPATFPLLVFFLLGLAKFRRKSKSH